MEADYHRKVWTGVEERLKENGLKVSFDVLSSGASPFSVVAKGPNAATVINPEFHSDLRKVIRESVASLSTGEQRERVLQHRGWPEFKIRGEGVSDYQPVRLTVSEEEREAAKAARNEPLKKVKEATTEEVLEQIKKLGGPESPWFDDPVIADIAVHEPDPEELKRIGAELGAFLVDRNRRYGNSFHSSAAALSLLYPNGIHPSQYKDALFLVRIWDKMKRIATDRDAEGESPYWDIGGYAILAQERVNADRKIEQEARAIAPRMAREAAKARAEGEGAIDNGEA